MKLFKYAPLFTLELTMIQSYFDTDDFNQPIKNFLTDNYIYDIRQYTKWDINLLLKENKIDLGDSYLPFGEYEKNRFYTVSRGYQQTYLQDNLDFFSGYIKLDQEMALFSRNVWSLIDMIGQVGGVFGIVQGLGILVINLYSERGFHYDVLSKCLLIDQVHPEHKDNDDKVKILKEDHKDK